MIHTLQSILFGVGYNTRLVILGTSLLGLAAGLIGALAFLRRRSLVSDALAHGALPGICLVFIISVQLGYPGKNLPLLLTGALLSGVAAVFAIQFLAGRTRLGEDAASGAILSVFFGAGIVLLSFIQNMGSGQEGGLSNFIYGQTAALSLSDVYLTVALALLAIVVTCALRKELILICFDPDFAVVQGWPLAALNLSLLMLVALVTMIGLQSVGLILVVAMLIIPPAAARFWTERLNSLLVLSAGIGALSGYSGARVSALLPGLPAGSVIVLCAGVLFILSFAFAPRRGLLALLLRRLLLSSSVETDHFLRGVYEALEVRPEQFGEFNLSELEGVQRPGSFTGWLLPRWLSLCGIISNGARPGTYVLTEKGARRATELTRRHRLWEDYVGESAGIDPDHAHFSADFVEHAVTDKMLAGSGSSSTTSTDKGRGA